MTKKISSTGWLLAGACLILFFNACAVKTAPSPRLAINRAGVRSSPYGPTQGFPDPGYWLQTALSMSSRFYGSTPSLVWIVGIMEPHDENMPTETFTGRVKLSFPAPEGAYPEIVFADVDANEAYLEQFDQQGFQVWLQVEPANADVETLIDLVLNRYGRHPCVIGFGIDVEWHRWSKENNEGVEVSDIQAQAWCERVRAHNPRYRLFLKHWLASKMPPTYRLGLTFFDDSQEFTSFAEQLEEFTQWGKDFAPSPVGFQIGYPADRIWWRQLADPPSDIGRSILARVPNTSDLYWVDFTMEEIWPPGNPAPVKK